METIMEVARPNTDTINTGKMKSNLELNIYPRTTDNVYEDQETPPASNSSNCDQENNDIIANENKMFPYDDLTPSSSPSTPEFCKENKTNEIINTEISNEFKPSFTSSICSEYLGDISDVERPENDKIFQRYKKTKYYERNLKSSYLYRKTNADTCSSSEESEPTNIKTKFNARKLHRRLRRNRGNKSLNVLHESSTLNNPGIDRKDRTNRTNANDDKTEAIESSLSETKLSNCQEPFVSNSVLSRPSYQRATPKENIGSDMNLSSQQREFHETLERGNSLELINLLQKPGSSVNINLLDTEGQTALHKTIMNGNFELVKILVNFGANTKLANRDGWTALHMAAHSGHANIMFYLISNIR